MSHIHVYWKPISLTIRTSCICYSCSVTYEWYFSKTANVTHRFADIKCICKWKVNGNFVSKEHFFASSYHLRSIQCSESGDRATHPPTHTHTLFSLSHMHSIVMHIYVILQFKSKSTLYTHSHKHKHVESINKLHIRFIESSTIVW